MALSVSAFPEHIQARHSNELLSPAEDGNTRNVVTSPRILGFFGGVSSGVTSKKPESHSSPRLGARDDEPDDLNIGVNTAIPTIPISPTIQFSPHNEKNIDLEEQGGTAWPPRRHQPSPFGRKTSPSPTHLGAPSVSNRLEFGAATRALPFPTHVPSKSILPLAHTAQPWGSNESPSTIAGSGAQALSSSRPLPILPNSTSDSFKLSSSPSSPGSVFSLKLASPVILPSRSAGTITGSSKHTNALPSPPTYSNSIPVPLKQSGSASRSRRASPSSTASPISTPSSKVLITQQQRGHNANSTSVSMRYQPLVVDLPSGDTSTPASSPPNQNNDSGIVAPSAIRPLPRVPPLSINFGLPLSGIITNGSNSTSHSHTPLKRPRTSPSSFSGFSGLISNNNSAFDPRSAFDNIPSSWASKPSGLSSSRPSSPPSRGAGMLRTNPRRPPSLKLPRARSWSRTRRDKSLDSYTRLSPVTPRTPLSSGGLTTPLSMSGGISRSLTVGRYGYQGLPARPLAKKPSVTPTIMGRQRERGASLSARGMSAGPALGKGSSHQTAVPSLTRNPSLRHVRPQCPSGPVVRTKSVRATSARSTRTSSPIRFNTSSSPKPASQSLSISKVTIQSTDLLTDAETSPLECLHIHPFLTPIGIDEPIVSSESPTESPLEFFVDGPETDVASTSRSPSPIEYALPPDNNELSDWHSTNEEDTTDDDLGGVSSSTSNSRGFAAGRRRTQLRSYQMDYRPQMQDRLAHDLDRERSFEFHDVGDATIQGLPRPARALPVPPKATSREKKKGKEESKKWSFGDFTSMGSLSSPSTPGTRTSSPERKGRSRQPRRLAEAVSLALGSGTRDNTASQSRSGRGSVSGPSQPLLFGGFSTNGVRPSGGSGIPAEYEVLDICMPSKEGKDEPRNGSSPDPLDFRIHEFSSTHRADMDSSIIMKRSRGPQDNPRSESSRSDVNWVTKEGKQSGLRDSAPVESRLVFRSPFDDDYESEDMPFMWLSRDKPPENPSPFIPLPPQRSFYGDGQPEVVEGSEFASSLGHKTLSREVFPAMSSSIGYAPLPPLSTLLVYPTKRGGKSNEVGRKQRTTSGPSRFNLSGGTTPTISTTTPTVDPNTDVLSMNLRRKGLSEADDDDIYCDEEPGQILKVDKHSEEGVIKSGRIGRRWEDSQEILVRSEKTNR